MSALGCFARKVAAGLVNKRAGRVVIDEILRLQDELSKRLSEAEAAREAVRLFHDQASAQRAAEADNALRLIEAQLGVARRIESYEQTVHALRQTPGDLGFGSKAPLTMAGGAMRETTIGAAARSLMVRDPHEIATGPNVDALAKEGRNEAFRRLGDAVAALAPKKLGLEEQTALHLDLLKAAFGDSGVAPPAQRFWRAFNDHVAGWLVDEFNRAGGDIPLLKNWRLPQSHDPIKVASVSKEQWIDFIWPLLDRDAMLDFDKPTPFASGYRALDDERLRAVLGQAHDTIVSRGLDGPPTAQQPGRLMMAKARSQLRVIQFRDAAGWQAYHDAFGSSASAFDAVMRHVEEMTRETAIMRVFGPNPEATRNYVLARFDREFARLGREAAQGADPKEVAATIRANRTLAAEIGSARKGFENQWAEMTGAANTPVNTDLANAMGTMRTALQGVQLGSAIVSSLTDPVMMAMTARFNGVPAMNVVKRFIDQIGKGEIELTAQEIGYVADAQAHRARQVDRYMGEEISNGRVAQVSRAIMNVSGLRRWTAYWRAAFAMEFSAELARNAGRAFADMNDRLRAGLERVGIDEAEWRLAAQAEPFSPRADTAFLRPADLRALGREGETLAGKVSQLVTTEMDYAVIDSDPVTRAFVHGGSQPGTLGGETRRAVGMYKSFPITFINTHFARAFARGWDGSRLSHAGLALLATWGMGVVAMQAKEIAQGRDPLSLDPTTSAGMRAYGKGFLQGGGLGIFGDLLFQDQTRIQTSLQATLLGPQFAALEDVLGNFITKNIGLAIKGEQTHWAGDALYLAGRYTPGQSLWFARLAFQRAILDQAALMIDERAPDRFRRIEREAAKQWGQGYWFAPGDTAPSRAPDLAAIGGGQ